MLDPDLLRDLDPPDGPGFPWLIALALAVWTLFAASVGYWLACA